MSREVDAGGVRRSRWLLPCLILLLPELGLAEMYRWVDEKGNVHFTDRRPAGAAEARPTSPPPAASAPPAADALRTLPEFWYPVLARGRGVSMTFRLPMQGAWVVRERPVAVANVPPQLEIGSLVTPGFKAMISFVPAPPGSSPPRATAAALRADLARQGVTLGPGAVETISGTGARGFLATSEDPRWRSAPPPSGEYRYLSRALVDLGPYLVVYSVLSNDLSSSEHRYALEAVKRWSYAHTGFNSDYDRLVKAISAAKGEDGRLDAYGAYRRSIERGPAEHQYLAGVLAEELAREAGEPAALDEARHWFRLAAAQGYPPALMKMASPSSPAPASD